ncbi:hypothetical protein ENUP19_0055G0034 [Entamoeba nuttalli]|uniref:NECAP PHear domain-containing protein n=2 Tax=Entamoeba nuttalli TaxID=412467 RepID=K2HRK2_ENTNP|nr:hypothetical protein ENU1_160250 [Entamoeba nuttalli P19]EKE38625.1 hypothetical protein ENU1_160250 [Entamoeba nuttalli P19]|eukprot:XP_008859040.1 hypothetical protein ENU1_160250 [Entamoeba nuttalli P19]
MTEQIEQILLVINQCMMYRIKPMTSPNMKYKAGEWTPEDFLWQGKCVVVARGDQCVVKFVDSNTDATFAQCPVGPGAVEPVIDSSRYFVVRIVDEAQGRKAFLGMGFQERSEAFDFTVALQDFERRLTERKERANKKEEPIDMSAFELKPGQTITLNIKSTAPTGKKPSKGTLLPPPSSGKRAQFSAPPSVQKPAQPVANVQTQQQPKKDSIDSLLFF